MKVFSRELGREGFRYLIVGSGGYLIDVGIFNILSMMRNQGIIEIDSLVIKSISLTIAVSFTYLMNSKWTFVRRGSSPEGLSRLGRYWLVNLIGLFITLIPLYISRNILGLDSLLADNISANVIGVGLALLFRFTASREWVFVKQKNSSN
jgi:putative flippase GtrA